MSTIPMSGSPRFTDTDNNSVDSTDGDWQFALGEENLYVINHKNNKKYKVKLEEVSS